LPKGEYASPPARQLGVTAQNEPTVSAAHAFLCEVRLRGPSDEQAETSDLRIANDELTHFSEGNPLDDRG
jgi:hypothetical protein